VVFEVENVFIAGDSIRDYLRGNNYYRYRVGYNQFLFLFIAFGGNDVFAIYDRAEYSGMDYARKVSSERTEFQPLPDG
jgi:hypothetical protein